MHEDSKYICDSRIAASDDVGTGYGSATHCFLFWPLVSGRTSDEYFGSSSDSFGDDAWFRSGNIWCGVFTGGDLDRFLGSWASELHSLGGEVGSTFAGGECRCGVVWDQLGSSLLCSSYDYFNFTKQREK